MINPEKLLGGLLRNTMGDIGGLGVKAGVGMGLLGVAFGAAEHFMGKSKTQLRGQMGETVPPPPPPGLSSGGQAGPIQGGGPPPPPPPMGPHSQNKPQSDAILLIRAMIASANADGHIDDDEKKRIFERLEAVNPNDEEKEFINKELSHPANLDTIVAQITNPKLAKQVYAVSLLAIDIDTDAEREYIKNLAKKLNLDESTVDIIHKNLNIEKP